MELAPIILFAYNRPDLLKQTLESLSNCSLANKSDLYVFSDGPKANATVLEKEKIAAVRALVKSENWCSKVELITSEANKGLARSIIDGVSSFVSRFGRVIVLEDDVLLAPCFLQYMNDALLKYADDENVLSIGSWNYFSEKKEYEEQTFFFRFPDSIAWATFQRAWNKFEENSEKLYTALVTTKKMSEFDGKLGQPYFSSMLKMQMENKISSWAIRWTALAILENKLTLFPSTSLSKHIGFTPDATHEKNSHDYNRTINLNVNYLDVSEIRRIENPNAIENWRKFYEENIFKSAPKTIRDKIKLFVPMFIFRWYRKWRYGHES